MRINFKHCLQVILISLFISFLFSSPNLIGYLKSGETGRFSGNSYLWDPWDVNVYVSALKYSQEFGWGYKNLYTTENSTNTVIVYPVYSLLGILFKNADPFTVYNISAFLTTFLLILCSYKTIKLITGNHKSSLLAAIIASFAGGFGWILLLFDIPSPDISLTPFIMANAFQRPHTSISLAFYFLSIGLFYKFHKQDALKGFVAPLICIAVSVIIYPYLLLSYCLILTSYSIALYFSDKNTQNFKRTVLYILILIFSGLIYSAYFLKAEGVGGVLNPSLKTPNILLFLGGIGLFIVPVVLLFKSVKKNKILLFIYSWIFTHFILAYTPFGFARYYFIGIFVPLSFLMVNFIENLKPNLQRFIAPVLIFFAFLTTLVLLIYRLFSVMNTASPYYWNKFDMEAIGYIKEKLPRGNFLSTYPFSNYIPTLSASHVYFGHLHQTPESGNKILNLSAFYNNQMNDNEAKSFLEDNNIDYIIWRKENSRWNNFSEYNKPEYAFLETLYSNDNYLIMSKQ